jgi:hypothetical protein
MRVDGSDETGAFKNAFLIGPAAPETTCRTLDGDPLTDAILHALPRRYTFVDVRVHGTRVTAVQQ